MPPTQISLRLDDELLAHIDLVAKDRDIKRTAAAMWLLKNAAAAYPAAGEAINDGPVAVNEPVSEGVAEGTMSGLLDRLDRAVQELEGTTAKLLGHMRADPPVVKRWGAGGGAIDVAAAAEAAKPTPPKAPRAKKAPGKLSPPRLTPGRAGSRLPVFPKAVKDCTHPFRQASGFCPSCGDQRQ